MWGETRRRDVRLGTANDSFVQVHDGLTEGAEVLLVNPEVVMEEEESSAGESGPRSAPAKMPGERPTGKRPTGKRPTGKRPGGK